MSIESCSLHYWFKFDFFLKESHSSGDGGDGSPIVDGIISVQQIIFENFFEKDILDLMAYPWIRDMVVTVPSA